MAPKPRKRQSRMHAAIDAMRPLGFSSQTVQAAVRALLKEYGGEDNWPFIEGDAYSLLISSMLEEQEGDNEKEESSVGDNSQEDGREGANTATGTTCDGTDAGTSKLTLSLVCAKSEDTGSLALQTVGSQNEEQIQKVLETIPITSLPPKFPTFAPGKILKPKLENSNGWLVENDDDDDDDGDGNRSDLAKLNLARNLARLKRKHSDI